MTLRLSLMDKSEIAWAQDAVTRNHYLHKPVDSRCSIEGYMVEFVLGVAGLLLFGRPQATKCKDWYGSVKDVQAGRCEVTRWQVLNLARVWLLPQFQRGGELYSPLYIPGFNDRHGRFCSTLASAVIQEAVAHIGFEYLLRRPPCFLNEPYEIRYLLSYCDTRLHKGTIYQSAGFELYTTNDDGIQTWRIRLPGLTPEQDAQVREAARINPRSIRYRAQRDQMEFNFL